MLNNAIWKGKHGKRFIVEIEMIMEEWNWGKTLTFESNYNTRNCMEEAKLCFCGSKSVLTSAHGPEGRKGGQGSIDGLFVSLS